jgi:hypothetical protein
VLSATAETNAAGKDVAWSLQQYGLDREGVASTKADEPLAG